MPLPRAHLLDELATAYIQTIAAMAGSIIAVSRLDYGVDGTLKHIVQIGSRFVESGYPVDFQLKGTTTAEFRDENVVYDLAVRNYNLLVRRDRLATPYYLFLVCFDPDMSQWMRHEPDRLILTAKSYWWADMQHPSENASSVRISVPESQRLDIKAVQSLLDLAASRFAP